MEEIGIFRKGVESATDAAREKVICWVPLGQAVSTRLHTLIMSNTKIEGNTQRGDHGQIPVVKFAARVSDRTAFLSDSARMRKKLKEEYREIECKYRSKVKISLEKRLARRRLKSTLRENPAVSVAKLIRVLQKAVDEFYARKGMVVGVACNTFHTNSIFNIFLKIIGKDHEIKNITVVNMLDETATFIKEVFPGVKKIGVLSTTGTRNSRLYSNVFIQKHNLKVVQVPTEHQDGLHECIYGEDGIKKQAFPVSDDVRQSLEEYIIMLKEAGAELVVLGCTEIPLAFPREFEKVFLPRIHGLPLLDPMLPLARGLVREASRKKLKPLTEVVPSPDGDDLPLFNDGVGLVEPDIEAIGNLAAITGSTGR